MLKTVSSITNAIGALNYKGTWNASTNSPALASGVGTKGDYYVVSVAGSTNLDGETLWGVGDWTVFNGAVWQKVEGGNTINATTVSASTSVTTPVIQATSSAGGTLKNNSGTAQLQWGSGGGSNLSLEVATNINPANAAVAISPTGTGTVAISPAGALTINPTAASTINNTSIGVTTAAAGRFSSITNTAFTTGSVVFAGASGVYSQDNANLFWDDTNNRLGLGTVAPAGTLDVSSATGIFSRRAAATDQFVNIYADGTGPTVKFSGVKNAIVVADATCLGLLIAALGAVPITFGTNNTEKMRVHSSGGVSIGNITDSGASSLNVSGLIYPQQATTAGAPAYVKGAIYFDTTLNKLRVGGATAWETITSV